MSLVDVIKFDAPDDSIFAHKHPSNKIKFSSQLIVNEGQQAIFIKGGQLLDTFGPGTHTLSTGNLPILEKVINLPFGGDTPFSAEVWFISTTVKRDLKWGTPSPIPLMDSALGFPVSVRSFGRWGVRINDAHSFMTQIVGTQYMADSLKISEYFIGEILQSLIRTVSGMIARGEVSVLQISALLNEISTAASKKISEEFLNYGVELINFNIESINIPDEELKKIQEIYYKTLEAKELSKTETGGAYAQIKSFEIMKDAAENTGDGTVGAMLGAGIGLGAGLPVGKKFGDEISTESSSKLTSPKEQLKELKEMLDDGLITQEQFENKRDKILESI